MRRRSDEPRREKNTKRTPGRKMEIRREGVRQVRAKVKQLMGQDALEAVGYSPRSAANFMETLQNRAVLAADSRRKKKGECEGCGDSCSCESCKKQEYKADE